jgi:alanine racemase
VSDPGPRALARVNLAALERNCTRLAGALTGGASLCAVVKADGYGHGAVQAARVAQAAGASSLAVATGPEALALRQAGIEGRILVMGALAGDELDAAVEARAEVVAWHPEFAAELAARAREPVGVHVKLDTGMGRLGTRDVSEASATTEAVATSAPLKLAGLMTHFATADEMGDDFLAAQRRRFVDWVEAVPHADAVVHAANSAATLRAPDCHFDMVRCGIAVYGMDPFHEDPSARELEPVMELTSYVADVKPCAPGESAGYGRRFIAEQRTNLAVLPIGYGDGVRRGLTNNADVLIHGRRYPLVGTVSMDNITLDVGPEPTVRPGDRATLIGTDGGERITAEDVAHRLDTINYEVTCGISGRVPRAYHRDGEPA